MARVLGDVVGSTEMPRMPGVEHRHVLVNGVRLHLAEAGAGPPLILLHGWPQHWWCWRRVMPRLAEAHRVLAPDLRGWGWSDAPHDDYRKATFAADILALMDAEGIDRARLLGHDWGGYVSFLLALEHPDRIERMVALDVAPPWPGRVRPQHLMAPLIGSYQALLAAPVIGPATMTSGNGFVRGLIRVASGQGMHWSTGELDVYARVLRDPLRARASSACYRSFLTRELPAALLGGHGPDDLDVPALLVMGETSPLRCLLEPKPSRNLRVEWIAAAGHFLPEEAPERVIELTLEHFGEGRPAARSGPELRPV